MKRILYAFILALSFCGCASDEEDAPATGAIVGSVADRTTGEPVATVNVSLVPGGQSTVTGSDGSFTYSDLEEGSYTISISKEGYRQSSGQFSVKAGQSTQAHLLIERIPATITPDRDVLEFGSNAGVTILSFGIVNAYYTALEYTMEYDCKWIKEVRPMTGRLETGKTGTIVVNIDRTLLDGGMNETVLVVRTSNGRAEIKITAEAAEETLPVLNTLEVTDIDVLAGSAVLHGTVESLGNPAATEQGFVYGLTTAPTVDNNKVISPRVAEGAYSEKITNLPLDKTFYVRAYAISENGIAYSDKSVQFTTNAIPPQVTTLEAQDVNISNGTATFVGNIDNAGTPAYTERGFVYSTMHDPTINDSKIVANGKGSVGRFSLYATGLPIGKTYNVRAYATSERAGTVYGDEITVSNEWIILQSANIVVQKEDLGCCGWEDAKAMCESSRLGGYDDWRLPTVAELAILYNNRELIGGFDTQYYSSSYKNRYWSSDYHYTAYDNTYYRAYSFYKGTTVSCETYRNLSVRAVRTLTK